MVIDLHCMVRGETLALIGLVHEDIRYTAATRVLK